MIDLLGAHYQQAKGQSLQRYIRQLIQKVTGLHIQALQLTNKQIEINQNIEHSEKQRWKNRKLGVYIPLNGGCWQACSLKTT
ncbi:TPA: hypothetical protein I7730_16280 [Vibrio vulnificus]|uniref:Uncharacterized protein n=1 Tax=Vibrio vulnificus TaxID=672 RepID=A0A8H9TG84_VIBVL|nr:hypothetical protein [Vibrio vulnificus]HAS8541342.1 hypothetical protein [Vibrio vulnificus]